MECRETETAASNANLEKLPLKDVEDVLGEATVLQKIEITKGRKKIPVAGCKCEKGQLKNKSIYRVLRNTTVLHEGLLSSMRHLKSEVDVIKADMECGLQLVDKTINFEVGDRLICFEKRTVVQKTEWDPGF